VPVEQSVKPFQQGMPSGVHEAPAAQAKHSPPRQVRPSPHQAPSGTGTPVSSQLWPELHVTVPTWQGAPAGWHDVPQGQ
jgi:hypothetical protein